MATITDATVRVWATGQTLRSDCYGNNAAIECPNCLAYPVLLVAWKNQRGTSLKNPAICRTCGCRVHIVSDVRQAELHVVDVAYKMPTDTQ